MGILTIIFSILGSIGSAISAVLKAIPPIGWLCLACILVGVLMSSKGCSCRRAPREPRPLRVATESFEVVRVVNGTTIEVTAGIRGKKAKLIHLVDISCPPDGQPFAEEARKNLELSCGPRGEIKHEGRRSDSGVCKGASGINLNLDQVEQGLAKCDPSAPDDWKVAEKKAKKFKRGIWGIK